ncbi:MULTISPECIES: hypothetical protein [unclassified Pseudomonas]|uniref:hypothetical protein n=1 Tax=unclassified Pseudomonas TaxID=196821 RepID=UPI000A099DC0|nr:MULTISPECIES: hypothetical protein [unclassified Pseudomonas]SMF36834.1 hypothetical protein SAMN02745962_03320 [Pseudomonas sp. LAIL14HWK12:I11]SMR78975.1 hypothetical protein SAMN05661028_03781 [Pseudomonas sp. LAIL14HWK12:I10]SOD04733.1 hypothetical protein SAMN05660296_03330 [Pseudomonas sp. LAIL14HWK12:I8]
MLIELCKRTRLAVNPDDVSSVFLVSSNGYRELEVKMRTGDAYRVRHQPECLDGDDIYQVHKQLMEAQ